MYSLGRWMLLCMRVRECAVAAESGSTVTATVYHDNCLADPWLGYQCLIIREPCGARKLRAAFCASNSRQDCSC